MAVSTTPEAAHEVSGRAAEVFVFPSDSDDRESRLEIPDGFSEMSTCKGTRCKIFSN
jgi:hypothetical protein